ncbi:hypothetical protein ACFT7S_35020 [Streptomyces sp. NPDC057136]
MNPRATTHTGSHPDAPDPRADGRHPSVPRSFRSFRTEEPQP